MELKEKLIITIIYGIIFFVLKAIMKWNNAEMKEFLIKKIPKLIQKAPWLFSDKQEKIINYLIGALTLGFLFLIWTNYIIIPLEFD